MLDEITPFVPKLALPQLERLLDNKGVNIIIKNERKTRHGDYRLLPNGRHQITINRNLNSYRFLITLVHEIAHLEAFKQYGNTIKPHGKAWKHTFKQLMLPFINPNVFPESILPLVAKHFINPKASSDTDMALSFALKQFDAPNNKVCVFQLDNNTTFKLYNGRIFKKGKQRVKRIECVELASGKIYLFNPNVEVEVV